MTRMIANTDIPQTHERREEIRRRAAMERPETMVRANREPRPYVVRDLSWELASYLETENVPAASGRADGNGKKSR